MTTRVAVDVGGTFTDVCVLDEASGAIRIAKVPSSSEPMADVLAGLVEAEVDVRDIAMFAHGTTIATNALITRRFPPAAMVTTTGFRDVLEIRRGNRPDMWDAYADVSPPYIRRRDRLDVTERVDYAGEVVTPLDEDEAREVARVLARRGVSTVAVCFINAYANGANEEKMRDILRSEMPDAAISISSEVLPEIFEHERFATTVANAVLSPLVGDYIGALDRSLRERGYGGDLLILHSGGGVMTADVVSQFALRLAGSGIAAGALASRDIAARCGFENAIGLDMGGTSTDVSLVRGGEVRRTKEWFVEFGYPICFPSIEVLTIGAGGGSLAWIDEGRALHSGPQSAGAVPGPVCYGQGNDVPTTSDANLALGRLGHELIGGRMELDRCGALEALEREIAGPLELDVYEAAHSVIEVANANMANALRLISIRRGYDPREFALVVFGGAGPLHGAALARELSIPTVLVPPHPGITSALGCLLVDVRHDLSAMFVCDVASADPSEVEAELRALEEQAHERLEAEGIQPDDRQLLRSIDLRYAGQWRSIAAPVAAPLRSLDGAVARFHADHQREHNYSRPEARVEMYRLNVTAIGVTPKPTFAEHDEDRRAPEPDHTRSVYFDDPGSPVATPVYSRGELRAAMTVRGPAVIEQLDSCVLVPPDVPAEVDRWLNIRMHIDGAS